MFVHISLLGVSFFLVQFPKSHPAPSEAKTDINKQEYWEKKDRTGEYPHDFHAALAKGGWIGIALPEELGGGGLGIAEATMMMQTISE